MYIMPLTVWVNSKIQIQISLVGSVKRIFSTRVRISRSRSSKVIDFGTNRKRVCDFPLVHHSNFGPILHRFRDIADFFCNKPLFHPNFGGVPFGSDRRCRIQPEHLPWANLPWNYFRSIPTYVLNVADRRTDRRTDDLLWHDRALQVQFLTRPRPI